MKKLTIILFILISCIGYSQPEFLKTQILQVDSAIISKSDGVIDTLIVHDRDSTSQYQYKNMADPTELLDGVNLRYLNTIGLTQPYDSITFTQVTTPLTHYPYKLQADTANNTITLFNENENVAGQLMQELWTPEVINKTGTTLNNGTAVYLDSVAGGLMAVEKADQSTYDKSRLIGVVTENILPDGTGFVTIFGYVRGVNLTAFSCSDVVYLGNDGALTPTKPSGGNYVIRVGFAVDCSANGVLMVYPSSSEYTDEVVKAYGFPTFMESFTNLTFNNSNRYLKILPVSTDFYYYQEGIKYITTGDSVQITDVDGLHVQYYDGATLTSLSNPTQGQIDNVIRTKTVVSYVYWDATNNKEIYVANERHTFHFDPWVHAWAHFSFGTQYLSGMGIPYITTVGGGSLDSDAQFAINSGVIADEDVITITPALDSAQTIPYYYQDGANWRRDSLIGFSFPVGATPLPQYNPITAGSGTLAEVTSGNFVLNYLYAINDNRDFNKIIAVVGQNQYASLSDAQTAAKTGEALIESGDINFSEFKHIYTFIIEGKTSFTNSVQARLRACIDPVTGETVDYVDYRTATVGGGGSGGGTGASSFLDLSDVENYTTKPDSVVVINSTATGVTYSSIEDLGVVLQNHHESGLEAITGTTYSATYGTAYDNTDYVFSRLRCWVDSINAGDTTQLNIPVINFTKKTTGFDLEVSEPCSIEWKTFENTYPYQQPVSSTAAANVGTGTGLWYRDKTGSTLNFKTLKNGGDLTITNNTSDVTVAVDKSGDWTGTFDGQEGSYYLSRTNHTGTQTASTISDFDTEVANNTDVATNTTHRGLATNPHSTDIGNLGSGTLSELNTALTDATLDDVSGTRTPTSHSSSHENGGGDEINVAGLSGVLADAQNADKINGVDVDNTNIADNRIMVYNSTSGNLEFEDQSGGGAPVDATYITQTANGTLTNEQALSSLSSGFMKVTTGTGVISSSTNVSLSSDVTGTLPIANGGTGQTTAAAAFNALSPLTTNGDILYYNSSSNQRLAIGTNGYVLTVSSGLPVWAAASGGGGNTGQSIANTGTYNMDYTSGNIGYTSGVTGNIIVTLTNVPDFGEGWLYIVQDGTGGNDVTVQGSTGYTTENYSGGLSNVNTDASSVTIIFYRRTGTILSLDFIWYE